MTLLHREYMTPTINVDSIAEADKKQVSKGRDTNTRLLPTFNVERLKGYAAENRAQELALANSDPVHRAELLAKEDAE